MSEPRGTPETSMEEILASIRRIISEDGSPGMAPASAPPSAATQPAPPPANPVPPPSPAPAVSPPAPINVSISPPPSVPPATSPPADPGAALRPPSSTTPSAVWGILGDRQVGTGEELVLTQMVAEDGSVVALDRPAEHAAVPAGAAETPKAQTLDVLLLTDALPETAIPEMPAPPARVPAA